MGGIGSGRHADTWIAALEGVPLELDKCRFKNARERDYASIVDDYCAGVLSGRIVSGKLVIAAVERYQSDRESSQFAFDEARASRACGFVETCIRHTQGEWSGLPFILAPFQVFVLWNLFGFVRDTGFRRYREAFISVGRGNGKTPIAAVILLYCMLFEEPLEPRADAYIVATRVAQAALCFGDADSYIGGNKYLRERIVRQKQTFIIPATSSRIEVAPTTGKLDGFRPLVVIRDEIHEWQEQHRDALEKLNSAMGKRRQPMTIEITTAGSEESEIWMEHHNFSSQVVLGEIEANAHFAFVAEIDDEDDELDPACWPKANPMFGFVHPDKDSDAEVVKSDWIADEAAKASIDPVARRQFRRYHCNKFTTSLAKLLDEKIWGRGALDVPECTGEVFAGLDWGSRDDLCAIAYCFVIDFVEINGETKPRYGCWSDVFMPRFGTRGVQRPPFFSWDREGLITVTETERTDSEVVFKSLVKRSQEFWLGRLVYDPYSTGLFVERVEDELGIECEKFNQNPANYNEPLLELVSALTEGRLIHGNCPVLRWCASNVITRENAAGYFMPDKSTSRDKIDPICALIMALSQAMRVDESTSIYESRGPIVAGRANV